MTVAGMHGEQSNELDGAEPGGGPITDEIRGGNAQIDPNGNPGERGPMQRVPPAPEIPTGDPRASKSTAAYGRSSVIGMKYDHSTSAKPVSVPDAAALIYVDDRELVRRTSIGRGTWQKMRFEGRGPTVRKIGRRCLYCWSEVVAWLEAHRVGGTGGGAVP